jgi:tripartite ATP-independent transporter DctM subunit
MHLDSELPVIERGAAVRGLITFNDAVVRLIGFITVILLVVETTILLSGVISRYVLHAPLTWSDELASILFIWLTMLGSVIALNRGEHMRLTALIGRLTPATRVWCETLGLLVIMLFLVMVLMPAVEHAEEQMFITTPSLEIPDGLRAAAMPVGVALMLMSAVAQLARRSSLKDLASCLVVAVLIAGGLYALGPMLIGMGNFNLIVFFVLLIGAGIAVGIPIAFAFGVATMGYIEIITHAPMLIVVTRMDEGMSHIVLLAVPLFIMLGALLQLSGLARTLIDFMASLLGHVRGGLQYVLLGAMFLVSGISGSKVADMAAVAPALFPEMKKRGQKPEELAALLSTTGAMTETIPPSLVLITIGAVCSVSITSLFIGGLMPAVVCTIAIGTICWFRARKENLPTQVRAPMAVVVKTLLIALPALILPVLIRLAVIEGVATATEVSTIGIAYTIVVGLIMHIFQRHIDFRRVYPMLVDTAALSGSILLIIGMATAMAWALTQSGFSATLVKTMIEISGGPFGFLLITILLFAILGSVLEGIPAIVLFGPLLFPVARALGIDDVHYSMVVILAMGLGLFAPPLGVGFYAACAISKVSPDQVFHRVWGYLGVLLISLLIVAAVPWISTGFL